MLKAHVVGSMLRPGRLLEHSPGIEPARYFPREQLAISPQCGFASDAGGNPLSFEPQTAKLRLVADVAHEVLA